MSMDTIKELFPDFVIILATLFLLMILSIIWINIIKFIKRVNIIKKRNKLTYEEYYTKFYLKKDIAIKELISALKFVEFNIGHSTEQFRPDDVIFYEPINGCSYEDTGYMIIESIAALTVLNNMDKQEEKYWMDRIEKIYTFDDCLCVIIEMKRKYPTMET